MAPASDKQYSGVYPLLGILLVIVFVASVCFGAVEISPGEIISALKKIFTGPESYTLNERILLQIRLPRAILSLFVGAGLAVGGTLMQALFRNPIVEPGLAGTSSGAAFGAALYFVLGGTFKFVAGGWVLPVAAFLGGALSTFMVFILSEKKQAGRQSVTTLLLMGIAINALFMSCVGFLAYIARDPQARSITFWNLGTLSGASWNAVIIVGITTAVCIAIALRFAKQLNALILGDDEAALIGVEVKKLKRYILLVNIVMIAVATAFVGIITFVGLVVPHLLRIWKGSDNRYLIIGGTLLGAVLLNAADLLARMALNPAELPIGIVTSIIGVPVFIYLLRSKNYYY
jgi:iron complex transport system permease protein